MKRWVRGTVAALMVALGGAQAQQAAEKLGLGRNTVTRKLGTVRGRNRS